MEARTGFEPVHNDFADRPLSHLGTAPSCVALSTRSHVVKPVPKLVPRQASCYPMNMTPPRRYPRAHAWLDVTAEKKTSTPPPSEDRRTPTLEARVAAQRTAVRRGLTRPPAPEPVPQALIEATADTAMLVADGGVQWFEVAIRHDVFPDLRCKISIRGEEVVALFEAPDANGRRLLEAESGRLRTMLEARGLKVAEIIVVCREDTPDLP